jgi:DNA-binding MarR family transcriptional regulator
MTRSFRLRRVEDLTSHLVASEIVDEARAPAAKPLMVHFRRASSTATRALREQRISFIGEGACFVFSPPMFVDRELPEGQRSAPTRSPTISAEARNPFGRTGSRVLRWLLLHPHDEFSMQELSFNTMISRTLVSRVTHALDEEAWVDLEPDARDRRIRRVRMRRPREALEAWGRAWDRRRIFSERWNVRAESVDAVQRRLKRARNQGPALRWALGGVAGASLVKRAVEPAGALLWVSGNDFDGLREALLPSRSASAHAQLRVAIAPDDFIFDLATERAGLPVVDQVQLWLDCSGEGERAQQAADAIAREMGW